MFASDKAIKLTVGGLWVFFKNTYVENCFGDG